MLHQRWLYHFIPGKKGSGFQLWPTHSLWDPQTLQGQWVSLTQSGKLTSNTARLRGDSFMQFSVWTLSMTALGPNVKSLGIAKTILRTGSNRGNGCRATLQRPNKLEVRVDLFLAHWTIQSLSSIMSRKRGTSVPLWGCWLSWIFQLLGPWAALSGTLPRAELSCMNSQSPQPKKYHLAHSSASTCWAKSRNCSSV